MGRIGYRLSSRARRYHFSRRDGSLDDPAASNLGYRVQDASPTLSGSAVLTESPFDAENPVLKLTSTTGDPISVATDADVSQVSQLSFDFLFEDPGKLDVSLGGVSLDTLHSPTAGPGSPGSGEFGTYYAEFDLSLLGIDPLHTQEFVLSLSGSADPVAYVDNLRLIGVPEPSALALMVMAALSLLLYRRRK